jgi:hypothetical protein
MRTDQIAAQCPNLVAELRDSSRDATVTMLAALMTDPDYQGNLFRLETVAHLAVAYCDGTREPTHARLQRCLNEHLQTSNVLALEDPPEDVFITNVVSPSRQPPHL